MIILYHVWLMTTNGKIINRFNFVKKYNHVNKMGRGYARSNN